MRNDGVDGLYTRVRCGDGPVPDRARNGRFFVWRSLRDDRVTRECEARQRQHERERGEAHSQARPW